MSTYLTESQHRVLAIIVELDNQPIRVQFSQVLERDGRTAREVADDVKVLEKRHLLRAHEYTLANHPGNISDVTDEARRLASLWTRAGGQKPPTQ